jgi:SpoVK/Ycf46/Vps4 family AAA+-type ATPase
VNALLTQLDKLKHRRNVLVMATSNLVKAIGMVFVPFYSSMTYSIPISDTAFVDRADIIQYVDLPPREAIYDILRSSLCEMASKGVVASIVCHLLHKYIVQKCDHVFRISQR